MKEVGELLEPGGLNKSDIVRCDDLTSVGIVLGIERTVVVERGKAMLCSNLHQWVYIRKERYV